jgi:hypothetical protein
MQFPFDVPFAMARNGSSTDVDGRSAGSCTVLDRLFGADSDGDPHPLRPTAWSGVVLILLSGLVSVSASGILPAQVRIRWSVGTFYGPEFAPTALVLWAFPLALAATYLGLRALAGYLDGVDELTGFRPMYEVTTLAVLFLLVLAQVGLVLANLA